MRLELAWGYVRRWLLRTFYPAYVQRMAGVRRGVDNRCPVPVLDPRDLKFYRNQGGYWWNEADDPFAWRERLPFARAGLTELWVLTSLFWLAAGGFAWIAPRVAAPWNWLAGLLAAGGLFCGGSIIWFFRNPRRTAPADPEAIVSPADGTVVLIEVVPHDEFVGGPALLIGIFLSVFNVHINRVPTATRIIGLSYRKGKFLNALRPESARENERLEIRFEQNFAPWRRMIVRQIAGAIARRIVCWVKPGDELACGEQLGMIKLGSRTELVLPREEGLELIARVGDKVRAGESILARYGQQTPSP